MASEEYKYPENIREDLLKISLTSGSDDVKDLPNLDVMKSDILIWIFKSLSKSQETQWCLANMREQVKTKIHMI